MARDVMKEVEEQHGPLLQENKTFAHKKKRKKDKRQTSNGQQTKRRSRRMLQTTTFAANVP